MLKQKIHLSSYIYKLATTHAVTTPPELVYAKKTVKYSINYFQIKLNFRQLQKSKTNFCINIFITRLINDCRQHEINLIQRVLHRLQRETQLYETCQCVCDKYRQLRNLNVYDMKYRELPNVNVDDIKYRQLPNVNIDDIKYRELPNLNVDDIKYRQLPSLDNPFLIRK